MNAVFLRNSRLSLLIVCLILVSGISSYVVMPRMEDPLLTPRAALITTLLPGADAERVESQISDVIEDELRDVEEIKEIRSVSRSGVSTVSVELRDDVYLPEADAVWSRIRDRIDDAAGRFPPGSSPAEFEELNVKAFALIVGLVWHPEDLHGNSEHLQSGLGERSGNGGFGGAGLGGEGTGGAAAADDGTTAYPVKAPLYEHRGDEPLPLMRRLAEELEDRIRAVSGTEDLRAFGVPEEEITVLVDPVAAADRGLTVAAIAQQLRASDARVGSGLIRSDRNLLLSVDSELDSADRIAAVPVQIGPGGQVVRLGQIADVSRGQRFPADHLAFIDGRPAISLGVWVRPESRVDDWTSRTDRMLEEFRTRLPRGVRLNVFFRQNDYVTARLESLQANLLTGAVAVLAVILLVMGWRSALIVGATLPLAVLMVLSGMRALGIPVHQMSVTGLIIALGLLIDNAIVVVDEVSQKLRDGANPAEAVTRVVRHLFIPLGGSTLTTALAFAPIALMPGPSGEFVGAISVSVILAICSSFLLSMTIIPAWAAVLLSRASGRGGRALRRVFEQGAGHPMLTEGYRRTVGIMLRHPVLGILAGVVLPLAGFIGMLTLPEQFFPPVDRDQFHVEVELSADASLHSTLDVVRRAAEVIAEDGAVQSASWHIGESAPQFYYNVIPKRSNSANYAHGIITVPEADGVRRKIRRLQNRLDEQFPGVRILVRQLEQGPPFDAPVELRLFGPDRDTLRELGDEFRVLLAQEPDITHTRSECAAVLPQLSVRVREDDARLAGLTHEDIALQFAAAYEGVSGGVVPEGTESVAVRVRAADQDRDEASDAESALLLGRSGDRLTRVPVSAVASIGLIPEDSAILHFNAERMNEVQGFLRAGALPAATVEGFRRRLNASGMKLPAGYRYEFGGEAARRDDAIGSLMANVGVLGVLMIAALVLSFGSFRAAVIVVAVAALSVGLAFAAIGAFGFPFGFMAIIGSMGLVGVAINDTIVVLAGIQQDPNASTGDRDAIRDVIVRSTRHVLSTSLTTFAGFLPLLLDGGAFWPPLAVAIAGGVGGATLLALYFAPAAFVLLRCGEAGPTSTAA